MKKTHTRGLFFVIFLLSFFFLGNLTTEAYVNVKGYYRSDGTYVRPHVRSNPNGLKYDNYSYSPGDGLYNDTYGTRDSDWDTPTYITDPDYYEGKSLYDSGSYNYYTTTPTCPSHSYYSSLTGSCKCNSGYVVDGDKCVYANTYCSGKYGYGSEYSYLNNNCKCKIGYVWNDSLTKCITENDYCQEKYGYHSQASSGKCGCKYGYVFYENKCIDEDDYCEEILGYNSEYNSFTNSCECEDDYHYDGYDCVEDEDEEDNTYAYTVNCPANAIAIGDYCYCVAGYQISAEGTGCEKKVTEVVEFTDLADPKNEPTSNNYVEEEPTERPSKPVECGDGFALSLSKDFCVKIPEHAHAVDSSSDVWLCDEGYQEDRERCTKIEESKEENLVMMTKGPVKEVKGSEKIVNEEIKTTSISQKIVNIILDLFKKFKF